MKIKQFKNPFTAGGSWFKANLHTHTTTSDGKLSPPDRVKQYRDHGYNVLALTDHRVTNDIRGMSDKKMLVISGMEYHPPCPTADHMYHLVGLKLPHPFEFTDADDANRCIREVAAVGGITILAHPFWCGFDFQDFSNLKGLSAMEVYNSTCARIGRACSENEWAYALDHGMEIPIVGVDDVHDADCEDARECWTWLKMPRLTVGNVLKAVRDGACYASRGPVIHDFRVADGKVKLRCSPVSEIHFVSSPTCGARRRAEKGKRITSFTIDMPTRNWPYVRAVVTDGSGLKAWTNPIAM